MDRAALEGRFTVVGTSDKRKEQQSQDRRQGLRS
jgi:hypothetical protein